MVQRRGTGTKRGFLVDLTMQVSEGIPSSREEPPSPQPALPTNKAYTDEERAVGVRSVPEHSHPSRSTLSSSALSETGPFDTTAEVQDETEMQSRPNSITEAASFSGRYIKKKTSQLLQVVTGPHKLDEPLSPQLVALLQAYASSEIASSIKAEIDQVSSNNSPEVQNSIDPSQLPDVMEESSLLRGRQRASWSTQFRILSGRAFKNLYRDPALLAAHYLSSVAIARKYISCICQYNLATPSTSHLRFIFPQRNVSALSCIL